MVNQEPGKIVLKITNFSPRVSLINGEKHIIANEFGSFVINGSGTVLPAVALKIAIPRDNSISTSVQVVKAGTVFGAADLIKEEVGGRFPNLKGGQQFTAPIRSSHRGVEVATIFVSPIILQTRKQIKFSSDLIVTINYTPSKSSQILRGDYYDILKEVVLNPTEMTIKKSRSRARRPSRDIKYGALALRFSVDNGVKDQNETDPKINGLYVVKPQDISSIFSSSISINSIKIEAANRAVHDSITPDINDIPSATFSTPYFVIESGVANGLFDGDDRLYFYGSGAHYWELKKSSWNYKFNYYDYRRPYWITAGTGVQLSKALLPTTGAASDGWKLRRVTENGRLTTDLDGHGWSDRQWVWKSLRSDRAFVSPITPIIEPQKVSSAKLRVYAPSRSISKSSNVVLAFSGDSSGIEISSNSDLDKYYSFNPTLSDQFSLQIKNQIDRRYIDVSGYEVQYLQKLDMTGFTQFSFWSKPNSDSTSDSLATYSITNMGSSLKFILRIDESTNSVELIDTSSSSSFSFSDKEGKGFSYHIASIDGAFELPSITQNSNTQNYSRSYQIFDTKDNANSCDYLIISPPEFLKEAIAVAQLKTSSGYFISPRVISTEDIFRDFSGGMREPAAIRNLMVYAHNGGWSKAPEYLMLFGNGNYDYKGIKNDLTCFIPPYIVNAEVYEDIYGLVDPGDIAGSGEPDLFVGRVPIQNVTQAQDFVDKMGKTNYSNSGSDRSEWRNRVLLISDDDNQGAGIHDDINGDIRGHHASSDEVGDSIAVSCPETDIAKLNMFDYPWNDAWRKPLVRDEMVKEINKGVSLFNYFGHGAYNAIADEYIFTTQDITALTNKNYPTIFSAFSCSVGFFDMADRDSAALAGDLILKKDGGSIVSIASTRLAYPVENTEMAKAFFKSFYSLDSNSTTRSVGQAYVYSRNEENLENYALFGDPSYRPIPKAEQLELVLTTATGDTLSTYKKLQNVIVKGTLKSGALSQNPQSVTIHLQNPERKNEKRKDGGGPVNADVNYKLPGEILYNITTQFSGDSFSVPIQVPYYMLSDTPGATLRAYAWGDSSDVISYGINSSYIFSGIDVANIDTTDKKGPEISVRLKPADTLGLDSLTPAVFENRVVINGFDRSSGTVTLEIFLKDQAGIDHYSALSGEGIVIEIEDIMPPQNLNSLYKDISDESDKTGKTYVDISRRDIPSVGEYNLSISARDILGNITKERFILDVRSLEEEEYTIGRVYCYPSPATIGSSTRFWFNAPTSDVSRRTLKIFTLNGQVIRQFNDVLPGVVWDLKDQVGSPMPPNVYLFRLFVEKDKESENGVDGVEVIKSKIRKMVIYPK